LASKSLKSARFYLVEALWKQEAERLSI